MRVTKKGSVARMGWVALVCGVMTWHRSRLEICAVKMTKAHRIERQSKPFGFADHSAAAVESTHAAWCSPIVVVCCPSVCMWLLDGRHNVLCSSKLFCHHILIKSMVQVWAATKAVAFSKSFTLEAVVGTLVDWRAVGVLLTCKRQAPLQKRRFVWSWDLHRVLLVYLSRPCCFQSVGRVNSCSVEITICGPDVDLSHCARGCKSVRSEERRCRRRQVRCNFNLKLKVLSQLVSN